MRSIHVPLALDKTERVSPNSRKTLAVERISSPSPGAADANDCATPRARALGRDCMDSALSRINVTAPQPRANPLPRVNGYATSLPEYSPQCPYAPATIGLN